MSGLKYNYILLFFIPLSLCTAELAYCRFPIRLLLLSGSNNHEWQQTSTCFKQIMEEDQIFVVDICERPDTLKASDLKKYKVLASNWNAFPEMKRMWGKEAEKAIMDFVNHGAGFVLFHSASATHYDWPEYHKMVGATWGKNTRHGKIVPFEVKITDSKHPITQGMSNFWITDELWVEMEQQDANQVICTAYAPVSNNGSDHNEPVAICRRQGKGRCFYLVLGHDVVAMQNPGWKTLMQRGTEWAAFGNVRQQIQVEPAMNHSQTY